MVKLPEANDQLKKARESAASSVVPGERMSRHELAERVNARVFDSTGEIVSLDAHYIAKLERGVIRWPRAAYRDALRAVLGVTTNLELGLRPRRTGEGLPPPSAPASRRSTSAEQQAPDWAGPPVRAWSGRESPPFAPGAVPVFGGSRAEWERPLPVTVAGSGLAAIVAESVAESVALGRQQEASDIGSVTLEQIDLAVAQFRLSYLHTPPGELFLAVRSYGRWVAALLDGRLTLTQRSRLCRVAGRLSDLLGRLSLDLGNHAAASAHCLTAVQLAVETGDGYLAECVRATQAVIAASPAADGTGEADPSQRTVAAMPGAPWPSAAPAYPAADFATADPARAPRSPAPAPRVSRSSSSGAPSPRTPAPGPPASRSRRVRPP